MMASALKMDTLAFSKRLREAGADEKLAEAIVEGLSEADTSELATKSDLAIVEAKLTTEISEATNRAVLKLGGLVGVLFVLDRLIELV